MTTFFYFYNLYIKYTILQKKSVVMQEATTNSPNKIVNALDNMVLKRVGLAIVIVPLIYQSQTLTIHII